MSRLLEKTDISPLIECRRWLGWAALAGKVYGLFILVGISAPSQYQGDWYKGWLCLSAGIIVIVLSFFLPISVRLALTILVLMLVMGLLLALQGLDLGWRQTPLLLVIVTGVFYLVCRQEAVNRLRNPEVARFFEFPRLDLSSSLYQQYQFGQTTIPWRKLWVTFLQRVSEVAMMVGATFLTITALNVALKNGQNGRLAALGFGLLIAGVNLSLWVEQTIEKNIRQQLARENCPFIVLQVPADLDTIKVAARFTLSRPLGVSFPRIRFRRVLEEKLSELGPVIDICESKNRFTPQIVNDHLFLCEQKDRESGVFTTPLPEVFTELTILGRFQRLEEWMKASQLIVVFPGFVGGSDGLCTARIEGFIRQKGIVIFPPINIMERMFRWEVFCEQFKEMTADISLSSKEIRNAVLLVFRDVKKPLLITADRHDEWTYRVAFQVAAKSKETLDESIS